MNAPRFAVALLSLSLVSVACVPIEKDLSPTIDIAANEDLVASRLAQMATSDSIYDLEMFTPYATLEHSPNAEPLPRAQHTWKNQDALNQAIQYAQSMDSSAFMIFQKDKIIHETYWNDRGPDTLSQGQSMMKPLTALVTGLSINNGSIKDINTPIGEYLSQWADDKRGQITIKSLLTMTSGLTQEPMSRDANSQATRLLIGTDIEKVALEPAIEYPHGTRYSYSNIDSQLLLSTVNHALNGNFAKFTSKEVWSKFALHDARLWLDKENGIPHGFCCLIASAEDWMRLGIVFLQDGRFGDTQIIPTEWIKSMTTPSDTNPNFGYQIWMGSPEGGTREYRAGEGFSAKHSAPYLVKDIVFFDGFGGQRIYIIPSKGLVIVRIGSVRFDWDDTPLVNNVLRALEAQ